MQGAQRPLNRMLHAGVLTLLLFVLFASPIPAAAQPERAPYEPPDPVLLDDINPGQAGSFPNNFAAIGSTVFFRADDDDTGQELWRINPPYTTAQLVYDILPGDGSSWPENLTVYNDILFFTAEDGQHGREVWMLEAPYTTPRLVADVVEGAGGSNPADLVGMGTILFFVADGPAGRELYKSQQPYTSAQVIDLFPGQGSGWPKYLVKKGWTLFFSGNTSEAFEVFKLDPPYSTPVQVSNVNPEGEAAPTELTFAGETLFFVANDPTYGPELWKSELPYNPLSTVPVNNFETRYYNSNPSELYAIGSTLFFNATIGLIGEEVWKVTPPYTTTQMLRVRDIREGFFAGSDPGPKSSVGTTLFFAATDNIDGRELWISEPPYNDDSTFHIDLVYDGSSNPEQLTPAITGLYFTAVTPDYGREVMYSSPPYENAILVNDIVPHSRGSDPVALTAFGTNLFFQAATFDFGAELWSIGARFGIPATGFAPGRVTQVGRQPAEKAYDTTDMRLVIEPLGVDVPVMGVQANDTGWDLSWLEQQAGYLDGTAFPTWEGNTVITAHSYLPSGLPGPFKDLGKLQWGSRFSIKAWDKEYVYEVREVRQTTPDDESVFAHEELDWVTLVTCQDFDEEAGEYVHRLVVKAVLVEVR